MIDGAEVQTGQTIIVNYLGQVWTSAPSPCSRICTCRSAGAASAGNVKVGLSPKEPVAVGSVFVMESKCNRLNGHQVERFQHPDRTPIRQHHDGTALTHDRARVFDGLMRAN